MKKRILALLLAGLLTASLTSCITSTKRPDDETGTGSETETEPEQTRQPEETTTALQITWEDVAEENSLAYVIEDNVPLTPVDSANASIKVSAMQELKLVKISSDDKRYIVEKDGVQYYVSAAYLTSEDILGKNFEK